MRIVTDTETRLVLEDDAPGVGLAMIALGGAAALAAGLRLVAYFDWVMALACLAAAAVAWLGYRITQTIRIEFDARAGAATWTRRSLRAATVKRAGFDAVRGLHFEKSRDGGGPPSFRPLLAVGDDFWPLAHMMVGDDVRRALPGKIEAILQRAAETSALR